MFEKPRVIYNQVGKNPAAGLKLKWNQFDVYTVEN